MAPLSNTPGLQLRILSLEVWSRTEADVFLLTPQDSFANRRGAGTVSLKGMGEMKEQCLLYPQKGTAHCILGGRL